MVAWIQLEVDVPDGSAEAIAEELDRLGAVATTFSAAGTVEIFEPDPGAQPLWDSVCLTVLFDPDADLRNIRETLEKLGAKITDVNIVEDEDWQSRWRAHAVRRSFGDRLWVLPRDEGLPDEVVGPMPVLRLDPGLAFGTGSHPTTRSCLEQLALRLAPGQRVLDFGCGSGILALAAALLGAREVVAIDHDPQALAATRENASYNGIAPAQLLVGDAGALVAEGWDRDPFDMIVANILANPLIELAPLLQQLLVPGGCLILSGVLHEQAGDVARAYTGIEFAPLLRDEDWACLVGRRVFVPD